MYLAVHNSYHLLLLICHSQQLWSYRSQKGESTHNASCTDSWGTLGPFYCIIQKSYNLYRPANQRTSGSESYITACNFGYNWWKCRYFGLYTIYNIFITLGTMFKPQTNIFDCHDRLLLDVSELPWWEHLLCLGNLWLHVLGKNEICHT